MYRALATLFAAAAVFGAGGLFGAAMTTRPDQASSTAAAAAPPAPVEVRTIVKRRTVHVYRKPKRRPVAPPAPAVAPGPAAPPATSVRAVAPAPAPLETRTSGAPSGEREHGDDESERGDD